MKRIFITISIACLMICNVNFCGHIHTKECGENFENCTHICDCIKPFYREPIDD